MDDIVDNYSNIAKKIDVLDIINRIKEFRKLDFKNLTDSDLHNAIYHVLCNDNQFIYFPTGYTYPLGTKFFRVRKLSNLVLPIKKLIAESSFWNPPPEIIKTYGSINKPHESLLYTAQSAETCIDEMNLSFNESFLLIKYETKAEVKVNVIGGEINFDSIGIMDEKGKIIYEIYNNFLRDEFSRIVGGGTEFLYRISEKIAKDFFDLPAQKVQDAWGYPSIKNKKNLNIVFRPVIAKKLLELKGGILCRLGKDKNIIVKAVTHGFDMNGLPIYYPLGSSIHKDYFPEVQCDYENLSVKKHK